MQIAESSVTFPMRTVDIERCIPHRYPFLLIDKVLDAKSNDFIIAIKNISMSDIVLQGHFPGNPVYPGVMIIESLAQAAGVLGHLSNANGLKECFLTEVSQSRFRKQVAPGDQLKLEVKVEKARAPFYWFDGTCYVGDDIAATVKFSALMR